MSKPSAGDIAWRVPRPDLDSYPPASRSPEPITPGTKLPKLSEAELIAAHRAYAEAGEPVSRGRTPGKDRT